MRAEGQMSDIGGGTVVRSVYRKKRLGATKKSPMYLHEQITVVRTELTTQHEMSTSSTRFTDAAKETNLGSRKSGKVATAGSGSRKSSNKKGKESMVSLVFPFFHLFFT